jgi:phage terminase large subunit GpA-like protein
MKMVWTDENGRNYRIINTLIDSGHYTSYVYEFVKNYSAGVYAAKGDEWIKDGSTYKPFAKATLERIGLPVAYILNTTKIKDIIATMFNLQWDSGKTQPDWFANFPNDLGDDIFRHFEAESRVDEYDKNTNQWMRSRWKKVEGRENHAFDCFVYNMASLEMIADLVCKTELGLGYLDWQSFWKYAQEGHYYN